MSTVPRDGMPTTTASSSSRADLKRRRFLLALSAGSAAGAAAAAQAVASPVVPVVGDAAKECKAGYRETDHIRDYYASTRL